jgi:hypothetical protein
MNSTFNSGVSAKEESQKFLRAWLSKGDFDLQFLQRVGQRPWKNLRL